MKLDQKNSLKDESGRRYDADDEELIRLKRKIRELDDECDTLSNENQKLVKLMKITKDEIPKDITDPKIADLYNKIKELANRNEDLEKSNFSITKETSKIPRLERDLEELQDENREIKKKSLIDLKEIDLKLKVETAKRQALLEEYRKAIGEKESEFNAKELKQKYLQMLEDDMQNQRKSRIIPFNGSQTYSEFNEYGPAKRGFIAEDLAPRLHFSRSPEQQDTRGSREFMTRSQIALKSSYSEYRKKTPSPELTYQRRKQYVEQISDPINDYVETYSIPLGPDENQSFYLYQKPKSKRLAEQNNGSWNAETYNELYMKKANILDKKYAPFEFEKQNKLKEYSNQLKKSKDNSNVKYEPYKEQKNEGHSNSLRKSRLRTLLSEKTQQNGYKTESSRYGNNINASRQERLKETQALANDQSFLSDFNRSLFSLKNKKFYY